MNDLINSVTFCGLHCDLCAERARIPRLAAALHEAMSEEGWSFWGPDVPGFREFWAFLEKLRGSGGCQGCRAGGGYPQCHVRICAQGRDVELCSQCPDFPCRHIEALASVYPTLVADNLRMQAVGLQQWLEEQKERVRRGVVYADIRYRPQEDSDKERTHS